MLHEPQDLFLLKICNHVSFVISYYLLDPISELGKKLPLPSVHRKISDINNMLKDTYLD
jgi:hypothetical protein